MVSITVTKLNTYIGKIINNNPLLKEVSVKGQISNFVHHSSGHCFFALKDEKSTISSVIFQNYVSGIAYDLCDGLDVICTGYVNLYTNRGECKLIVKSVEIEGEGTLQKEYNELKSKLESEGLFYPEYKKPIPKFPKKIGVITSNTGAAVEDIKKTIRNKNNFVDIIIYPTLVQGIGSVSSIKDNIRRANDEGICDVLIVGRGGGAIEDLLSFNDEGVVREIFSSKIPIISGIGHEIDNTLSDFVSDARGETPTAAANIAIAGFLNILDDIENAKLNIENQIYNHLNYNLDLIDGIIEDIRNEIDLKISNYESSLDTIFQVLKGVDPRGILRRGYVHCSLDDKVISSVKEVSLEDRVDLTLEDGDISCKVVDIRER